MFRKLAYFTFNLKMSVKSETYFLNSFDALSTIKEVIFDDDLKYDIIQVQNRSEPSLHITKKLLDRDDPQPIPAFNLLIHLENGSLLVEVFTYHNKIIFQRSLPKFLDSDNHAQMVDELQKIIISFKVDLRLCAGISEISPKELPISEIFIEPLMNAVVVRSRICAFGLWAPAKSSKACSNCSNLVEKINQNSKSVARLHHPPKEKTSDSVTSTSSINCLDCGRKFKHSTSLVKHVQVCAIRSRQTNLEDSNFKDLLEESNTRISHQSAEDVTPCDQEAAIYLGRCMICMKKLQNPGSHRRHIRLHRARIPNIDEPVCCPLCGLQISCKLHLNKHFMESHPFSGACCVQCLSVIPDGSLLVSHLKNNHLEKRILCPECGDKFRFPGDLRLHMASYHRERMSVSAESLAVVCDQCGKEFPHRKRLVAHVRVSHNKSKQYACQTCSKVFNENYRLRKHMAVHSSVKPFKCRHCDFRTNRNDNLTLHTNKMHKEAEILLPNTLDLKSDLADALLLQFNADV